MNSPWASVVIPIYNAEKYLGQCVESLCPSVNDDVEIILVDDGSNDETAALCDGYSDAFRNVRVFHKSNGGSSSARNIGLSHAKGEWIWFVDSDDMVSPIAFDVLKMVSSETSADVIQLGFIFFKKESDFEWTRDEPNCSLRLVSGRDFLAGTYAGDFPHFNCSFFFKKELLQKCARRMGKDLRNLFREDVVLYEDVLFCETVSRVANRVGLLSAQLYACRHTPTSVTNKRSNKSAASGLKAIRLLEEFDSDASVLLDKKCMEIGLLFSCYKLVEKGPASKSLKFEIREEIGLFGGFCGRNPGIGPAQRAKTAIRI